MKRIITLVLTLVMALSLLCSLTACNKDQAASTTAEATKTVSVDTAKKTKAKADNKKSEKKTDTKKNTKKADSKKTDSKESKTAVSNEEMEFISPDGWRVRYNGKTMEAAEVSKHAAQFVYTGKSAGTNMVEISYIANKAPEEVLYEVTSDWTKDDAKITRSEGFFPGTSDKWGYWRELPAGKNGSGLGMTAIAGEYNGGVLLFEVTSHMSGKDEIDIAVSDALSGVIDSIQYLKGFKDQTMFSYYPGTYKATGKDAKYATVKLNKDHSGILTDAKGKKTNIIWKTNSIEAKDGSFEKQFTIEGDNLYLTDGDNWVEYAK
ncbi:MAG: hypothetical protein IKX83_04305 [Clostridia bacterium]|nr:hypothetical protein [Clostridia bacterium]